MVRTPATAYLNTTNTEMLYSEMTLYSLTETKHFGGTLCLHLQFQNTWKKFLNFYHTTQYHIPDDNIIHGH